MNPWKQFWTLLKFQPSINPFILFMPVMFALPLMITHTGNFAPGGYHPSLDLALSGQNLFFVGFMGVMWLAPEIFQFGGAAAIYSSGTEFLTTRAVDRPLLYRSRATFFYLLVLTIPMLMFFSALRNPSLQVGEYNKISHDRILAQMAGSIPAPPGSRGRPTEITIPYGNILAQAWVLWMYLVTALGTQALIFLVYPLKYRRTLFWSIYMGFIFLPLFFSLSMLRNVGKPQTLPPDESFFFIFAHHQVAVWMLTGLGLILGQLWCERRFARMDL
jgi:hypothetical protein